MRTILLLAALAAPAVCTGCGAYVAYGESRLPYQGRSLHSTHEAQVGFNRPRFAPWSLAITGTAAQPADSAPFLEPRCYTHTVAERQAHKGAGCHPEVFSNSTALEVQYRWRTTGRVRPVASMALGSLRIAYSYPTLEPNAGTDSSQTSPFVALRGGGELSLVSWLHVALLAGYRESFRNTSVNKTVSNSGFVVTSLLLVGQRYP